MKALRDPQRLLAAGLAAIRQEFQVPAAFPPEVVAAAEAAATRSPGEHVDRTGLPFVTLDPASSTDLDQAFTVEQSGADLVLRYAIADVAWFVADGDPVDAEAWRRGATTYLPDGKAGLYPPVLAEGAASLLPDGDRPAVVLEVRVSPDGEARLAGAERAIIRSRAKLAYATATADDLPPHFAELARRIAAAEARRGAARIEPPQQEVAVDDDGRLVLRFRPRRPVEEQNAALSLAANLAVAQAMLNAGTGLFRVMAEPDDAAERRLRATAAALGLTWPDAVPLQEYERQLQPARTADAALMLAIRRAGQGAAYAPFSPGERPWHAAVAATYAHATAPLRRLADRYVLRAVLAITAGKPVPDVVAAAFRSLPRAMAKAEARDGQIERAVVDLAEAALLAGRTGERFAAVVVEANGKNARIQLCDQPVVSRIALPDVAIGTRLTVRLASADLERRRLDFAPD